MRSAAASGSSPRPTSRSPTSDTVFAFSEVKLGIIPAVISPYALRKIGESAARRYFVTGERFDAATALRIGLVHEVAADLDAALAAVLGELRTAGPRAARHAKRLVLERPDGPETARRIAERRTSDEGQAGLGAFLERERPPWAPALEHDAVTALLALVSAVFIGSADFLGGMTSRTANGIRVAAFVAVVGLPMALAVSLTYGAERRRPRGRDLVGARRRRRGRRHRVLLHRDGARADQRRRPGGRRHRRGDPGRLRSRPRRAARRDRAGRARRSPSSPSSSSRSLRPSSIPTRPWSTAT